MNGASQENLNSSNSVGPPKKFNGGKDKHTDFAKENVIYAITRSAAVLLGFVFTTAAFAQQSLHDIRKKGLLTFVYKLPVDSAEKYLATGMKGIDHFLSQIPFTNFNSDSVKYNELPTGNYLLLSVEDNELVAEYYCRTKTKVYTINNQHRVQNEDPDRSFEGCRICPDRNSQKRQDEWRLHNEFYKNKLVMFAGKINKGPLSIEIELEPRYTGKYNLNPAKAELMYFPVFYGRNEMKHVEIKK